MPSNIVLADAQATPVNHTFTPVGLDSNGVYYFEDASAASAIGNWRISIEVKRPSNPGAGQVSDGRSYKYKIGLHEPVLEAPGTSPSGYVPAAKVAYVPRAIVEIILPERALLIDRKNIRKMFASLLADTQIVDVVENLKYVS